MNLLIPPFWTSVPNFLLNLSTEPLYLFTEPLDWRRRRTERRHGQNVKSHARQIHIVRHFTSLTNVTSVCLTVGLCAGKSVCPFVSSSIYLSAYLSSCVQANLCVPLSVCLSVRLCAGKSVRPSVCLPICPPVYRQICVSICLCVHLSVQLSVFNDTETDRQTRQIEWHLSCVSLYICLSIFQSVHVSVCLSTYLSVLSFCLILCLIIPKGPDMHRTGRCHFCPVCFGKTLQILWDRSHVMSVSV